MSLSSKTDHWNQIYQLKNFEECSWYQENPRRSMDLIKSCDLAKDSSIIDIGAGESLLADRLYELGFRDITLLDISINALERTHKRLNSKGYNPKIIVSDILDLELGLNLFNLWHDRACFHFLQTETEIDCYLQKCIKSISIGGYLILSTFAMDGPEKCSNLSVHRHDQESIKKIFGKHFLIDLSLHENHETPNGNLQSFNFFVLKKKKK